MSSRVLASYMLQRRLHLYGLIAIIILVSLLPVHDGSAAAAQTHPKCPVARVPGPDPLPGIAAAIRRASHHVFNRPGERRYRVEELYSLQPRFSPSAAPGIRRIAVGVCGATVANRSWAVFVTFPYWVRQNRSAARSQALLFVADTPAGWRVWYRFE